MGNRQTSSAAPPAAVCQTQAVCMTRVPRLPGALRRSRAQVLSMRPKSTPDAAKIAGTDPKACALLVCPCTIPSICRCAQEKPPAQASRMCSLEAGGPVGSHAPAPCLQVHALGCTSKMADMRACCQMPGHEDQWYSVCMASLTDSAVQTMIYTHPCKTCGRGPWGVRVRGAAAGPAPC